MLDAAHLVGIIYIKTINGIAAGKENKTLYRLENIT